MDALLDIALTNAVTATLLGTGVAVASRWIKRPALAHALWLIVFCDLLTPPVVKFAVLPAPEIRSAILRAGPLRDETARISGPSTPGPDTSDRSTVREQRSAASAATALLERAAGWIEEIWLTGTLLVLLLGLLRAARFNRKIACPAPADPALQAASDALAKRIRLRRAPRLRLVRSRISPLIWFRRGSPTVLFPEHLLAELGSGERDALLLHELAHVKRGDHWVRLLEFAASALFWWHPLLYWARRELRRAEEKTCDAWVLKARPGVSEEYARGLVKTMEFLAGVPPHSPALATGLDTYQLMEERLNMILKERASHILSKPQAFGLAVIAMMVLLAFPTRAARPTTPEQGRISAAAVAPAPIAMASATPGSGHPARPPQPPQAPPVRPVGALPPTRRAPAAPPAPRTPPVPRTGLAPAAAPDAEAFETDRDDAEGAEAPEEPTAAEETEELQRELARLDEARAELQREYEEALESGAAIGVEGRVRGQVNEGVRGSVEGAIDGGIDGGIEGRIEGGIGDQGRREVERELRVRKQTLAELNRESERLRAAQKELLDSIATLEKELKALEASKRR